MKLINLLIRELNNCSSGGDFRVSFHSETCEFECFSLEIIFKRARSCNYEVSQTGSKFKKMYYNPKYGIFGQWLSEVNTLEMKNFHIHLVFICKTFNSKANISTIRQNAEV